MRGWPLLNDGGSSWWEHVHWEAVRFSCAGSIALFEQTYFYQLLKYVSNTTDRPYGRELAIWERRHHNTYGCRIATKLLRRWSGATRSKVSPSTWFSAPAPPTFPDLWHRPTQAIPPTQKILCIYFDFFTPSFQTRYTIPTMSTGSNFISLTLLSFTDEIP